VITTVNGTLLVETDSGIPSISFNPELGGRGDGRDYSKNNRAGFVRIQLTLAGLEVDMGACCGRG